MSRPLIDLTQGMDAWPRLPPLAMPAPAVSAAATQWCRQHDVPPEHLPRAPGFELDVIQRLTVDWGTQIDAPSHSHPGARGLDQVGLDELVCDGIVLDLRSASRPGEAISIDALQAAIDAVGRAIRPGDAVLLRTGQEQCAPGSEQQLRHPGMTREGTLFLTLRGARVLGTDTATWDRPFDVLQRRYRETGDPGLLWDGHLAVAECEAFIVRRLQNLDALPSSGFKVGFFPLKVAGATTSPCRAVAFLDA